MVLAAALIGVLTHFRVLRLADDYLYDVLLRQRQMETPNSPRIVLVTIDEESIQATGEWPWSRDKHGQIVDYLNAAGAAAIGYDILFIEGKSEEEDEALAASLAARNRVVLAAKREDSARTHEGGVQTGVYQLVLPHKRFREVAAYGIVNVEADAESGEVVRTYRPGFRFQDRPYPSFATAVYESAFGLSPETESLAARYIGYYGPPGSFPTVPAYLLLTGQADPALFRNSIVLVGPTFSDSQDFHATPLRRDDAIAYYVGETNQMAGVEIHANILHTLIHGTQIALVPRWPQAVAAVILALLVG
jgi:adenylate cyclase